jgi:hypothetical protein
MNKNDFAILNGKWYIIAECGFKNFNFTSLFLPHVGPVSQILYGGRVVLWGISISTTAQQKK